MPNQQRVIFLYRAGHVRSGSKIMRCDQLCEIANEFLSDRYIFSTRALPRERHLVRQHRLSSELVGDIVIFLKRADKVLTQEALEELRQNVRGMAVDYVDAPIYPLPDVAMDAHISSSFAGKQALDVLLSGVFEAPLNDKTSAHTVLHHADPRIRPHQAGNDAVKFCYFGDLKNTYLPATAKKQILSLSQDGDMPQEFYQEMLKYNIHYCVREVSKRPKRLSYKPFTKGFNAAASHANILVNRQVPDALHFLGEDYPFMLDNTEDETIQRGFEQVKAAFGTPIWEKALSRVAGMRARVAPAEIARQLDAMLQSML